MFERTVQMGLQKEIDERSAEIRTDAYAMSLGELMNLYRDEELDIHPEFQRFFRWTSSQKSRLIESLLLGIPIPQIFVAQRPDGVWDVVDGVQRLSTIFEFAGILRDDAGKPVPPLVLEKTKYLPSLEGKKWQDEDEPATSFSQAQRLYVKRAKLDVSIILKESDEVSKYELFQRLNTGGSQLSDQEVRNCILVLENRELYAWMRGLAEEEHFGDCVSLTDRALEEQYDLELVLRFLAMYQIDTEELKGMGDVGEFLTETMLGFAQDQAFDTDARGRDFRKTFEIISEHIGLNAFRRYDRGRDKFVGGFLVSAFEVVAAGVGYHCCELQVPHDVSQFESKVKAMWQDSNFTGSVGSGVRASSRIPKTIEMGRDLFSP